MSEPLTITDERIGLPSASGFDRLQHCAGSREACAACPAAPTNAIAAEGTAIHLAKETNDDSELSDEQKEIYSKLDSLEQMALSEWAGTIGAEPDQIKSVKEERVWIRNPANLKPLASAKLDIYWISGEHALGLDYKTGFKACTNAELSWQLKTQALGLWHESGNALTSIRMGFAHARLKSKLDIVDFTTSDLENANHELKWALWRSEQPDAQRTPGYWCQYCSAKAFCRECIAFASLDIVPTTAMPLQVMSKEDAIMAVSALPPEALAKIHQRKSIIDAVLDAVTYRLKQMDDASLAAIGLAKRKGAIMRSITDDAKAFGLLKASLGDSAKDCLEVRRTTAIELYQKENAVSKKAATEAIDTMLDSTYERDETGEVKRKSPSIVTI